MRDIKSLTGHTTKVLRDAKEKLLARFLRKEVDTGANGKKMVAQISKLFL